MILLVCPSAFHCFTPLKSAKAFGAIPAIALLCASLLVAAEAQANRSSTRTAFISPRPASACRSPTTPRGKGDARCRPIAS